MEEKDSTLMKIALISDVHSNWHALKNVMKSIEENKCDKIHCLGDVVGYGPQPKKCWDLVQKKCEIILTGNHEECVCLPFQEQKINHFAAEGVRFSRKNLTDDDIKKMNDLPELKTVDSIGLTLCHGTFTSPSNWNYVLNIYDAKWELEKIPTMICAIGHTHKPVITSLSKSGEIKEYRGGELIEMNLDLNNKYLINVGSVGQPRDKDPRSCYFILDYLIKDNKIKKITCEMKRIPYDISETVKEMDNFSLSERTSRRLIKGT